MLHTLRIQYFIALIIWCKLRRNAKRGKREQTIDSIAISLNSSEEMK